MSEEVKSCRCGSRIIAVLQAASDKTWMIQCWSCNRTVYGEKNKLDAIRVWNQWKEAQHADKP